jgi:hypothetical protein
MSPDSSQTDNCSNSPVGGPTPAQYAVARVGFAAEPRKDDALTPFAWGPLCGAPGSARDPREMGWSRCWRRTYTNSPLLISRLTPPSLGCPLSFSGLDWPTTKTEACGGGSSAKDPRGPHQVDSFPGSSIPSFAGAQPAPTSKEGGDDAPDRYRAQPHAAHPQWVNEGPPPESKGKHLCVEYWFRSWPWPSWA